MGLDIYFVIHGKSPDQPGILIAGPGELSYMSIQDALAKLRKDGVVGRFSTPGLVGAAASRARQLYFTTQVDGLLKRTDAKGLATRALFRIFAEGDPIAVRPKDKQKDIQWSFLVMLHRNQSIPCVWEFRPQESTKTLRVLGFFGACDLFVALRWSDDLHDGNYPSAIEACRRQWKALLPAHPPFHRGSFPNDFLRGAYFAKAR